MAPRLRLSRAHTDNRMLNKNKSEPRPNSNRDGQWVRPIKKWRFQLCTKFTVPVEKRWGKQSVKQSQDGDFTP